MKKITMNSKIVTILICLLTLLPSGAKAQMGFDVTSVEAYINGYADVEHTLRQLVYHKPNYQICILNQRTVDEFLQFKSYERV